MLAVLLLQLSMMGFAQDTSTTSTPSTIESFSREAFGNSSITSTACHFKISRSSLKDVLKLMRDDRTNIIMLDVWIESASNTTNRSLVMTDVLWANEIGRTLYSLMFQTAYPTTLISSVSNVTLAAGFRHLSVTVFPENEKCLLFQNHTSDVFSDLLNQLYRAGDEDSVYELCQTHYLTLNCCAISAVGEKDMPICFDYSSIANTFPRFSFLTTSVPILITSVIVLLILININESTERSSHYGISDSPMSLSTIIHEVFIVEHGTVLSSGKKLLVAFLVIAAVLPVQNCAHGTFFTPTFLYCLVCPWVFFYVFSNLRNTSKLSNSINHETLISLITLPFNLKYWWRKINTRCQQSETNTGSQAHLIPLNSAEQSETNSNRTGLISAPQRDAQGRYGSVRSYVNNLLTKYKALAESSEWGRLLMQSLKLLICRIIFVFLLILYLVIIIPLCCVAVCLLVWATYQFLCMKKYRRQFTTLYVASHCGALRQLLISLLLYLHIYADALIAALCFFTLSSLLFYLVVGLFLNGETFTPYFVLISTILFYAWSNWRYTVETKYVELITNIYEVCHEIENSRVDTTTGESENATQTESTEERNEGANSVESTTSGSPQTGKDFSILIYQDGEIAIPIDLYEMVRKTILPYDVVLFHYFVGVLVVALFAYFLYVLMSLFKTSGISSSVEALTSISGAMLPIVFSLVWRTNTEKQNTGEVVVLKSKLKRFLQVCSKTNTEIKVKFIGNFPEKEWTLKRILNSLMRGTVKC